MEKAGLIFLSAPLLFSYISKTPVKFPAGFPGASESFFRPQHFLQIFFLSIRQWKCLIPGFLPVPGISGIQKIQQHICKSCIIQAETHTVPISIPGESKIDKRCPAAVIHHVCHADIPMHHISFVQIPKDIQKLTSYLKYFLIRKNLLFFKQPLF